jgi:hypothetical protein
MTDQETFDMFAAHALIVADNTIAFGPDYSTRMADHAWMLATAMMEQRNKWPMPKQTRAYDEEVHKLDGSDS